ncbi:MAG: sulfatase [Puniceicoccaceae bacterium]
MKRIGLVVWWFIGLVVLGLGSLHAGRPNIIVILTDDQDKESIGAYGADVWTPNLDRFAAEGMLFHNAFVSSTVCTPSRYAFLTGRYASRSTSDIYMEECPEGKQAFPAFNMGLEEDNLNVGAVLSQAGYRTGYVGKFHVSGIESLRRPEDFEKFGLKYLAREAVDSAETAAVFRHNELQFRKMLTERGFDWAKNIYMGNMDKPYSEHNLEWTIDAALEFIEDSAKGDKPFYLHFCTTLVHGPDGSWSRSMNYPLISGEGRMKKPVQPEGMLSREAILKELEKRGLDKDKGHAGYSWVDAGVGAIMTKLKKLGIDENTLVIFTADHGSNQKGSLYDVDGTCVPFLARWPGNMKAGGENSDLVQSIDIAATAFDLAKAEMPDEYVLDGNSLVPVLKGQTPDDWRDHVYVELGFGRAIRTKDFKYIAVRYPEEHVKAIKSAQLKKLPQMLAPLNRSGIGVRGAANPNFYYDDALFQVSRDKLERNNLVSKPEFSAKLREMRQLLTEVIQTTERPYGELVPGGDALGPGQVEEQQVLARQMIIRGKEVILPDSMKTVD